MEKKGMEEVNNLREKFKYDIYTIKERIHKRYEILFNNYRPLCLIFYFKFQVKI